MDIANPVLSSTHTFQPFDQHNNHGIMSFHDLDSSDAARSMAAYHSVESERKQNPIRFTRRTEHFITIAIASCFAFSVDTGQLVSLHDLRLSSLSGYCTLKLLRIHATTDTPRRKEIGFHAVAPMVVD